MRDANEMNQSLRAIQVFACEGADEYYEVGRNNVTAIEWGSTNGHMAPLATVKVYRDGNLHSEHPFCNVLGVYYAEATDA